MSRLDMRSKTRQQAAKTTDKIASPKAVLKAAEKAPRVFSIGAYFRAIYVMREKGHSWRAIEEWLRQFNIEVSYVHLRRLFVQESERLSKLSRHEMEAEGLPDETIEDILKGFQEQGDPTRRLDASDPEPECEPEMNGERGSSS